MRLLKPAPGGAPPTGEPPCPLCNGTGWTRPATDEETGLVRCECWRRNAGDNQLLLANIPKRLRNASLAGITLYDNPGLKNAVKHARTFIERFPVVDHGLCLIGPNGIGKSHIAVAILRQLCVEKLVKGVYYDTRSLLSDIRETYSARNDRDAQGRITEQSITNRVTRAELLVLDDLGAERPTEWVHETMPRVLQKRYDLELPTIFTTNYNAESPGGISDLQKQISAHFYSRLVDMCELLTWDGLDYRTLRRHEPAASELSKEWHRHRRTRHPGHRS
ncbi:MAG: ATP-binding protein [Acidobacteria bacterium]|nr:ATP-binding protein [Acidobacteriota bacterium]